ELEGTRNPKPNDAVRRHPEDRSTHELDGALVGRDEARQQVVQGGLAGPVRAQDPGDLAGLQREADVADRDQSAEALAQVPDFENRAHADAPNRALSRFHVGATSPWGR